LAAIGIYGNLGIALENTKPIYCLRVFLMKVQENRSLFKNNSMCEGSSHFRALSLLWNVKSEKW
jgi:hypothetical protein